MKTRACFFVFSALLTALFGVAALVAVKQWGGGYAAYAVGGLAAVTGGYLVYFYNKMIGPLHVLGNGMDLLKAQDFASRLRRVGEAEADRIVDIFNRMITQLHNERLRVREQNHFLDLLVNASPVGVVILNFDGEIAELNPAAAELMGIGSPAGMIGCREGETGSAAMDSVLKTSRGRSQIIRMSNANVYKCTHSAFIDRGFSRSFFLVELLTEEVRRAEMMAYGKVIRMIAHEVNNTAAGIISTLYALEAAAGESGQPPEAIEALGAVIDRTMGMNRFIARFADVVRIPEPQLREQDLNAVVRSCQRFMEAICSDRNIRIVTDLCLEPPIVGLDVVLFEQALVNIIKNSAEAIEGEGTIAIATQSQPRPLIEISDTGRGIDAATEARLFTPFFSTKPQGQGIGLIWVREILQRHGCTFSLRTYEDGLTRFRIVF
jgi:nitrogen fixation/metabolism regulation signal transduction histidine kinase